MHRLSQIPNIEQLTRAVLGRFFAKSSLLMSVQALPCWMDTQFRILVLISKYENTTHSLSSRRRAAVQISSTLQMRRKPQHSLHTIAPVLQQLCVTTMRCSSLSYSLPLLGSISDFASGTSRSPSRRQTAEVALRLSDLCVGPELDGSSLIITCSVGASFNIPRIDLNTCLHNDDGVLGFSYVS